MGRQLSSIFALKEGQGRTRRGAVEEDIVFGCCDWVEMSLRESHGVPHVPSGWTNTVCPGVKLSETARSKKTDKQYVKLRKATGDEGGCRGILWRLDDLEKVDF